MSEKPATAPIVPALKTRRVVTGHDAEGQSMVVEDANCRVSVAMWHEDFVVTDAWRVDSLPTTNAQYVDPCRTMELEALPTGNVCRIVQFPPDSWYMGRVGHAADFEELGSTGAGARTGTADSPHALMHRTNTVDYIIVVSGEVYAVLDRGEVLLRQGDVLIQRGTNHAWSNRSDRPCMVVAVLNGAEPLNAR